MKNAIDWFGIPSSDFDRAVKFYQSVFNTELRTNDMNGTKVAVLPHDRQQHGIGGAIYHGRENTPSANGTVVYLHGGKDLTNVLSRVEAAGGRVVMQKTAIGDNGFIAQFLDS